MRDVSGKTALITGAAAGIGLGMTKAFLDAGMNVVMCDVQEAKLASAIAGLEAGARAHSIVLDVSDRAAMNAAAAEVDGRFGPLHILCNNAGLNGQTSIDEVGPEEWDWLVSINLNGVMNGLFAFLPGMKAHGEGGHVVNTSSIAGLLPMPVPGGTYSALKFAVRGLSDSLRMALAPHRIGVSVLCPGLVRSDIRESAEALIPDGVRGQMKLPDTNPMAAGVDPSNAGMSPLEVGERVLEAICENRAYILTHADFVDELREEFDAILDAFPKDQDVDPVRQGFENGRREAVRAARAVADQLV